MQDFNDSDFNDSSLLSQWKREATQLQEAERAAGGTLTRSQACERVARAHHFRDWNTAAAHAKKLKQRADTRPLSASQEIAAESTGTRPIINKPAFIKAGADFIGSLEDVDLDRLDDFGGVVFAGITSDGGYIFRLSIGSPHDRGRHESVQREMAMQAIASTQLMHEGWQEWKDTTAELRAWLVQEVEDGLYDQLRDALECAAND